MSASRARASSEKPRQAGSERGAAAALAHLQEQEEIDGDRTAMVGHSEGGLLILQAAAEGKGLRQPPAALVLLCTPGRPLDIVLREQLSRDPVMLFFLRRNDEIVRAIRETGQAPENVPSEACSPPRHGACARGGGIIPRVDTIEREYRDRIGRWSGQQRVARSFALFEEIRAMLRRKILAAEPDLDERTLKKRVAECLYRTDRETQRLLSLLEE